MSPPSTRLRLSEEGAAMVSSRVRGSSKQMRLSDLYKTGRKKTKQTKTKKVLVESEKPAAKVPVVDDGNDSHCGACSADGDLVCCDGCPAAFHAKCVGLDPDNLPEGDWFCDKCAAKDDAEAKPAEVAAPAPAPAAAATKSDYETERLARIQSNKEKMAKLVMEAKKSVAQQLGAKKQRRRRQPTFENGVVKPRSRSRSVSLPARRPNTRQRTSSIRSSARLRGENAPEAEHKFEQLSYYDDDVEEYRESDGRIVLDEDVVNKSKDTKKNEEHMKKVLAHRCDSKGRGSLYDSKAGITCHFCRQKKLCGEPDCPRCSTRSVTKECIGKSECSRCHSHTGRFCRACLLIRYGQVLEDVRKEMEVGTWLCPHCYEEDHPENGWICNSSICMTRRGLAPTGIAIYEAQERGFPSVAHYVQAKILKRKEAKCVEIPANPK